MTDMDLSKAHSRAQSYCQAAAVLPPANSNQKPAHRNGARCMAASNVSMLINHSLSYRDMTDCKPTTKYDGALLLRCGGISTPGRDSLQVQQHHNDNESGARQVDVTHLLFYHCYGSCATCPTTR
jgi:hypothetical protein